MAFGTKVEFDAIREKSASIITTSYTSLGVPFYANVRLLSINNTMDQEIYISYDGITNHLRMPSNSFKLFDLSANKIRDDGLFLSVGTQIYVKFVNATTINGSVWAEVMYAEGGK